MESNGFDQVYHPVDLDRRLKAQKSYEAYSERYPHIINAYNDYQKARTLEDFTYHIRYLEESLAVSDAAILIDYTKWAKVLLSSLGLPENCLSSSLVVLRDVIDEDQSIENSKIAHDYIEKCLLILKDAPKVVPSFITDENPLKIVAHEYLDSLLLNADRVKAHDISVDLVNKGIMVREVYLQVFQPVLYEVGRLWQMQKISVAQEHYVTASTQQILAHFYLKFIVGNKDIVKQNKTLVTTCVSDELHEVGIRMVADFFELDGWNSYYIGANSPLMSIIQTIRERNAIVVAISSTMSYNLPHVHSLIRAIRESPETQNVKIIIGGYPFNIMPDLWKKVGANGYAKNAEDAVYQANELTM